MRPVRVLIAIAALAALAACSSAVTPTPSAPASPSHSPEPTVTSASPSPAPTESSTPAPAATPDPTPEATPAPTMSADEEALIAELRPDIAVDCVPRRDDLPEGASYAIECDPGTPLVQRVGVYHFDSPNDAAHAYMTRMAAAGVDVNSGECQNDTPGEGAYVPGDNEGSIDDPGKRRPLGWTNVGAGAGRVHSRRCAPVAQWIERHRPKVRVGGSSPSGGATPTAPRQARDVCGAVRFSRGARVAPTRRLPNAQDVADDVMTTQELLEQWREATRAAELAERLAKMAAESVERSDQNAKGAQEIARMAERAARSAERAAKSARAAAERAARFAGDNRGERLADANDAVAQTRQEEAAARDRYHEAEAAARSRHST